MFFFLALVTSAQIILLSRNCTWKTTVVITVHGHAYQEGSGDQEDVRYLCGNPRTSDNNTAVITLSLGSLYQYFLDGIYAF